MLLLVYTLNEHNLQTFVDLFGDILIPLLSLL